LANLAIPHLAAHAHIRRVRIGRGSWR
jgi:hypothetical protein